MLTVLIVLNSNAFCTFDDRKRLHKGVGATSGDAKFTQPMRQLGLTIWLSCLRHVLGKVRLKGTPRSKMRFLFSCKSEWFC